jgi:hypothetical protein
MRKTLTAIVAAAVIVGATFASARKGEASCWNCWAGDGRIAGGLFAGVIITRGDHGRYDGSYSYSYPLPLFYAPYRPAYYVPAYDAARYYTPRRAYVRRYHVRRYW